MPIKPLVVISNLGNAIDSAAVKVGASLLLVMAISVTVYFAQRPAPNALSQALLAACLTMPAVLMLYGLTTTTTRRDDPILVTPWLMRLILVVGLSIIFCCALSYARHQRIVELAAAGAGIGAALAAGGVLGFLFGIPRALQAVTPPPSNAADTGAYRPNTNLERISDWLTTIIIGLTLVQFDTILKYFDRAAGEFAKGLNTDIFSAGATLVFFAAITFLVSYLWTRLRLMKDFEDADRPIRQDPEYYEGLMNAYLFTDPPVGFTKAIEFGDEYKRRFRTLNGRIWMYLACAYGQQHKYLTKPPLGQADGTDKAVQDAKDHALECTKRAIEVQPDLRDLLECLWRPDHAASFIDDDLSSLADDDDFIRLFKATPRTPPNAVAEPAK